jgi:hypothetical protein
MRRRFWVLTPARSWTARKGSRERVARWIAQAVAERDHEHDRDLRVAARWSTPAWTVVVSVSRPQVSGSGGFDWGDAGIGAGAVFGLVLIGAGGTLVVTHRGRTGAKRSGRAATAA